MTVLPDQTTNVRVPGQGARAMKRRVVLFTPVKESDDVEDIDDGGDDGDEYERGPRGPRLQMKRVSRRPLPTAMLQR